MTEAEVQAKSSDGRTRTVRELLDKAKYAIDFYQREFAWQERQVTLQAQALLAPFTQDDPPEVGRRKVALVPDFLDIWLARRVWNFRTISYSFVKYTFFILTKELRGRDVQALSEYLWSQLDGQPERFARESRFRLHGANYRQVRHILARLSFIVPGGWVDRSTWGGAIEKAVATKQRVYEVLRTRVQAVRGASA